MMAQQHNNTYREIKSNGGDDDYNKHGDFVRYSSNNNNKLVQTTAPVAAIEYQHFENLGLN